MEPWLFTVFHSRKSKTRWGLRPFGRASLKRPRKVPTALTAAIGEGLMRAVFGMGTAPAPTGPSKIEGCIIWSRPNETNDYLFYQHEDGRFTVMLEGYAIVPADQYPGKGFWPRLKHAFRALRANG